MCVHVCACACTRMHVYVFAFCLHQPSKRIETRKWSMMGNTVFYLKKKKQSSCFHNCTLLGRGTHLKI